jgi:hypothetical protein
MATNGATSKINRLRSTKTLKINTKRKKQNSQMNMRCFNLFV